MIEQNVIIGEQLERICDLPLGELLLRLLKTHEDNVIQIDAETGEEMTADSLLKQSVNTAKWLINRGVKVGDRISVISENRLEYCVATVAIFFAGATIAPLNPDYTARELKHVLRISEPKIIFCSATTTNRVSNLKNVEVVSFDSELYLNIIKREVDVDGFNTVELDPASTVATILCSSGTTGLPKGVMTTHENINAFIDVSRVAMGDIAESFDTRDPMLGLMPFYHAFGFYLMFTNVLRGKLLIIMKKFQPKLFLDAIVRYKITRLIIPPPLVIFLVKNPIVAQYDLSCIKEVRCGAAPLGEVLENDIKDKLKVNNVSQAYGMTETTLGVIVTPRDRSKVGSCGKIVPGMMVKVINDKGEALGPYQEGEICVKGPLVMKGYAGDPRSTKETIDADGWLHTGDVAYYDDEQYFYIVDRIKELIKYKGYQVAPAELEHLLLGYPGVRDVAVVGLPDDEAGEVPIAFVVKKRELTEDELIEYVKKNISKQKWLRGGVVFVDSIPRTSTGKILRRVLKTKATDYKSKL